jgi:4-hydroxy-tetrahydrodipicolinate synthase
MKLEGIFIPSVTPFHNNGDINFDALGDLLEYWIDSGISGLIPNASTSEGPYLNPSERIDIIEYLVEKADGRLKILAGTGAMATRESINLTRQAREAGAEAALITTPFFFKPSDEEIYRYFSDILEQVDLPVILYNVPKFTGYSVKPEVVSRISEDQSNLVGIKDSSGNPGNMAELIRLSGKKINCLSGSADMILPTLILGGKGSVVAVANVIPGTCVKLYNSFRSGEIKTAAKSQKEASYVNQILVRENPQIAAIKEAINQRGFEAGIPRRPLLPLSDGMKRIIRQKLSGIFN